MFSLQSRSSAGKITKNIKKLICLLLTAIILMGSVVLFPKEAKAAPFHATADMLQGTAYAVLTDAGELIFFRSNNTYAEGAGQTVTDIKGNTYTGRIYTGVEATGAGNPPWYAQRASVLSARVADGQAIKPSSMYSWFYNANKMTSVDINRVDASAATTMFRTFSGCKALTSLDVSGFDTSSVTNMSNMFANCNALNSLDVSGFDTSSVTMMSGMFSYCNALTSLDVSGFDTSSVTSLSNMFYYCNALTSLDVSGFDTSSVTMMTQMFLGCNALTSLDVSGFDTSSVTDMSNMFANCNALTSLDVSRFDTSSVTMMNGMFGGCNALTSLDVSGFDTSNVTNMNGMFSGCNALTSLDVSGFDTSNVTDMNYMFRECTALTSLNLNAFDTSSATGMSSMFSGCKALTSLDVSGFDTSSVTSMSGMFNGCKALTSLDVSGFDTSSVTSMYGMFQNCNELTLLDVSGFDTSNLTSARLMFSNDTKLARVIVGQEFNFSGKNLTENKRIIFPSPSSDSTYTGKWIREDKAFGPYTAEELRDSYTPAMAGTWVWEKVPTEFTVNFVADSATGSMPNQELNATADSVLPSNTFKKFGYTFDHWDDGQGHTYADGATIPAGTYTAGDTVTLTAVFVPRNTTVNMQDGAFDLYIYGNETATFSGLPAGTNYQVYEETPDGWVLVSEENISGIIHPLETAEAKFVNRYQPGTTSVRFSGVKTLDGSAAPAGSFTFELLENDTVIQTKTVTDGGFVLFDEIVYTSADVGVHRYKIREVPSEDEYDYDTHIEEITVTVVDNGDGTMSATTVYDQDGIRFINSTRPGSLRLTKRVTKQTDANENDEFTFKIKLTTPNGQIIDDDLYWYIEGQNQP